MTTESDENPYAAPAVAESLQSAPETSGFVRSRMNLHVAWLLAVLFNLPVPVMLGESAVSDPRAIVGLPLGIMAVYFAGVFCCLQRAGLMWRLIVGSGITALGQFIPFAHMMIGIMAMGISEAIFDPDRNSRDISSLPEAASATVLTGLGLIILSLMMGAALFAVFRIRAFDTQPYKLEAPASEPQP
jgi:hypothetical protein